MSSKIKTHIPSVFLVFPFLIHPHTHTHCTYMGNDTSASYWFSLIPLCFLPLVLWPPPISSSSAALSFTPSGLPLPPTAIFFFLYCQKQIYSACDACRAEECEWTCVFVCVRMCVLRGCRVSGEGRCVCTIRDKIMAPQGLVWPCTRSIKQQLQVPRSTLMSIFWGLIFHTEHTHAHTHFGHTCFTVWLVVTADIPCVHASQQVFHSQIGHLCRTGRGKASDDWSTSGDGTTLILFVRISHSHK